MTQAMTVINGILDRIGEHGFEIALFLAGALVAVAVWAWVHPQDFVEIEYTGAGEEIDEAEER